MSTETPADRPERNKSPDAFRTISEVAKELDLPQHVLRFWETKFPQLKPLKRGGGRRYYRPEDLQLLKRIRDLLYVDGYTIKGVQKLLRKSGSVRSFIEERDDPEGTRNPEGTAEFIGDEPSASPSHTIDHGAPASLDVSALDETIRDLKALRARLLEASV